MLLFYISYCFFFAIANINQYLEIRTMTRDIFTDILDDSTMIYVFDKGIPKTTRRNLRNRDEQGKREGRDEESGGNHQWSIESAMPRICQSYYFFLIPCDLGTR